MRNDIVHIMDMDQFKEKVGRLSRCTNRKYVGTATRISNNYILTAVHLLYDSNYGGRSEKVTFSLFYSNKCYTWKVTSERCNHVVTCKSCTADVMRKNGKCPICKVEIRKVIWP